MIRALFMCITAGAIITVFVHLIIEKIDKMALREYLRSNKHHLVYSHYDKPPHWKRFYFWWTIITRPRDKKRIEFIKRKII